VRSGRVREGVGNVQCHGRVRSLTQVPSLCEPDETRRLCASLVAYCGHLRAVRARQRAVRTCARGRGQCHGRVRSLMQVPSLCEPDETRRLRASLVAYCGHMRAFRARQRAVRACARGHGQCHGRVRSLMQVPSLCEPDETRRLCASLVAYCGHLRAVRARQSAVRTCARGRGQRTVQWQGVFVDAGTITL
jgi:hypothetical protein